MTIALIVVGLVLAGIGCNTLFISGQERIFWNAKLPHLARAADWDAVLGGLIISVACACFYIAGTMA